MHTYYVYLLTNANHAVLYVGVTNDLARRVSEHKAAVHEGLLRSTTCTSWCISKPTGQLLTP
ncbi:GIY-YIG nuclease family protein [Hymenobacter sp. M29]|uniref:GIY-YIG nuclease family protein n=1 Tax=Hymenobacter mellowenesis TaxID=3063995 RepID=A0ABT9A534_9BACT|nr:GIY-YIG nuclease family protein [Hymenobacter sp. M29]MDO7844930.1 GIY-YIG nuclease family protein [Hymenobacter sp. M29]